MTKDKLRDTLIHESLHNTITYSDGSMSKGRGKQISQVKEHVAMALLGEMNEGHRLFGLGEKCGTSSIKQEPGIKGSVASSGNLGASRSSGGADHSSSFAYHNSSSSSSVLQSGSRFGNDDSSSFGFVNNSACNNSSRPLSSGGGGGYGGGYRGSGGPVALAAAAPAATSESSVTPCRFRGGRFFAMGVPGHGCPHTCECRRGGR